MKKILILNLLFTLTISSFSLDIIVVTQDRILTRYNDFIGNKEYMDVDDYTGSDRDVAEMIYIQKALYLGGLRDVNIIFKAAPTALRVMKILEDGEADIIGTSSWINTLNKYNVLVSDSVIDNKSFTVGVYVKEDNYKALDIKSLSGLKDLIFVTSSQWESDWNTLRDIGIIKIMDNPKWSSMISMIKLNRADATLAPFQSSEDLSMSPYDVKMIPIPGIKIALTDYRSIGVRRGGEYSNTILEALNRGIEMLKDRGELDKAYTQSGFYNEKVRDWVLITPGN